MSAFSIMLTCENFVPWLVQIHDDAGATCKSIYATGLMFACTTDIEWALLFVGMATPARHVVEKPVDLADNATRTEERAHDRKNGNFIAVVEKLEILKAKIITSLGPINLSYLRDPIHGTRNITIIQIINIMREKFGCPSGAVIKTYQSILDKPIGRDNSFAEYASAHRNAHVSLARSRRVRYRQGTGKVHKTSRWCCCRQA